MGSDPSVSAASEERTALRQAQGKRSFGGSALPVQWALHQLFSASLSSQRTTSTTWSPGCSRWASSSQKRSEEHTSELQSLMRTSSRVLSSIQINDTEYRWEE